MKTRLEILMPQFGETVAEGTVATWFKKIGDAVKADEALFEVESDKATTEVPAPADGIVSQIFVAAGSTVPVGTVLAAIETDT